MKKQSVFRKWIPGLFLALAVFLPGVSAFAATYGIAVTPARVVFEDVLPGSSMNKLVQVSNLDTVPQEFLVKKTGDVANWITFVPGDTFLVQGSSSFALGIEVQPPQNTGPGIYTGEIQIVAKPTEHISGGAGAQIAPGVVMPVSVNVTGTVRVSLSFVSATVDSVDAGKCLPVIITLENSGNVTVNPDAKIEILDTRQESVLKTFNEKLDPVAPGARSEIRLCLSSDGLQQEINYWANIRVTLDGAEIGSASRTFDMIIPGEFAHIAYLDAIQAPSVIMLGGEAQIVALVTNDDKAVVRAQFRGEITKDGKSVASLQSSTISIPPGADGSLTTFFAPVEEGEYTITGNIYYGAETLADVSEPKTVTMTVYSAEVSGAEAIWSMKDWGFSGGMAVIVLLLVIVLWRQNRHVHKPKESAH